MRRANGAGRHDLRNVPEPLAGFPGDIPTSVHNTRRDLTPVAVVDVFDAQRRVRALARIDLLDRERRTGGIDEASYLIGRELEAAFEQMNRVGGGGQWWDDRIDNAREHELRMALGFDRAMKINALLNWILKHVGKMDTRILWWILGCRFSYATAAAALGKRSTRGLRYVRDRFSDSLAALAEAKAARGRALRR